jgi:hypothetical protein
MSLMAKPTCYQPAISRFLIRALYHEGKRRGVPMTRLVDELLTGALKGSPGWRLAEESDREAGVPQRQNQPSC